MRKKVRNQNPSLTEIDGMAAIAMPYGSPVMLNHAGRFVPARLELDWSGKPVPGAGDDMADMAGVLKRPAATANFSHCDAGDRIRVRTDGGICAFVDGRPVWLELRNGQPIDDRR